MSKSRRDYSETSRIMVEIKVMMSKSRRDYETNEDANYGGEQRT